MKLIVDLTMLAVCGYFLFFGLGLLIKPALVSNFAIKYDTAAGKTEVRAYYGALSIGMSGFFFYLLLNHLQEDGLSGILMIASAVFVVRVIGTVIDKGWKESYTKLAIPTELGFVIFLGLIRILS
jgi:hypothetical protein